MSTSEKGNHNETDCKSGLSASPELARILQMLEQMSMRITALEQVSPSPGNLPILSDNPNPALLRGEQSIIMSELIDRLNLTDGDKRRLRRDYGDLVDAIGNTSGGAEALVAAGNDPIKLKALIKNRAAVIFDTRRTAIFKSAIINTVNRELTPPWREEQVAIMDGFIDSMNLTAGDKRRLRRNSNLIGILENSKSGAAALAEAKDDPAALLALLKSRAGRIFDTRGTKKYVDAINSL